MTASFRDDAIGRYVRHYPAASSEPLFSELCQIGDLLSYHRLQEWFAAYAPLSAQELQPLVAAKLAEAQREAHERAWELPGS